MVDQSVVSRGNHYPLPLQPARYLPFHLLSDLHQSPLFAANLGNIGRYYLQYERLMNHWAMVLDISMPHIQYEELVANQEQWTRRMLEYCGLAWDDACMNFHETKHTVATASYNQVRARLCATAVGVGVIMYPT